MGDTKDIKGSFEGFIGKESAGLRISICGLRIVFMIENQKGCILYNRSGRKSSKTSSRLIVWIKIL